MKLIKPRAMAIPYKQCIGDSLFLYNTNCIGAFHTIEDESIDLILTDPPYNLGTFVKNAGRNRNIHSMNRQNFALENWDNMSEDDFNNMMDEFFKISAQKLKVGGTLLLFCSFLKIGSFVTAAQKYGFYYKTAGVWHKPNPMPRNMNLHFVNSNEAWLYFVNKKKTGTFNNNGKLVLDYYECPSPSKAERALGSHPTQKPLLLIYPFVELLSNEGDLVCDPFMGSGTVGVVCRNTHRRFIGIEIDDKYYEVAVKRMEESKYDQ